MPDVLNPACVGRTINVSSACGCTLTAATITGFSSADIVALGNSETNLTRTILAAGEAKMLGVPERNLMTLLNSNIREIGKKALEEIMVRRLKEDIRSVQGGFPQRNVCAISIVGKYGA